MIAHLGYFSDALNWRVLILLIFFTLLIIYLLFTQVKDYRPRWMLTACVISIFFYSGFGIAYDVVDNKYVIYYVVFLAFFCIPFLRCRGVQKNRELSNLDTYLLSHFSFLESISILYIVLLFIPLIYPEFKLFNPLLFRDEYWDTIANYRTNPIISLVDTIAVFIRPFFFAYLVVYLLKKPDGKMHLILFGVMVLFSFMRLHYLGRNSILTYLVEFLLLAFCVKQFDVIIKKKHILSVIVIVLTMIPFLYAYQFTRNGNDVAELGFIKTAQQLISSEFSYPIYYDRIINNLELREQTPWMFILYVVFLPIPSVLWAGKPTLRIADSFTHAMFGLSRGDIGFFIALPSVMGESFQYFGPDFFWIFALISGTMIAVITRYLLKHQIMTFYLFYLVIQALTYGRGGTTALLPTLVNGVVGIVCVEFYLKYIKKRSYK